MFGEEESRELRKEKREVGRKLKEKRRKEGREERKEGEKVSPKLLRFGGQNVVAY